MSDAPAQIVDTSGPKLAPRGTKRAELVAKQIVDDIFDRQLAPGTKLPPERLMIENYGVSRGTLREALRILEVHGLLLIRPGSQGGPTVAAMTAFDFNRACSLHLKAASVKVEQLWQARVEVEPMLARLAAQNLTPESTKSIRGLISDSATVPRINEMELLSDFHRVVASASGNPILSLFARSLGEMTAHLSGSVFPESKRKAVSRDHVAIGEAILAGDADRAEELAASHMKEMLKAHATRYAGTLDDVLPYLI
jgi:GntR family transcriptional regulator, transcriptional repressor for pyruvate dehydrogenase complex